MSYIEALDEKLIAIRRAFAPVIGQTLSGYQCAELYFDDDNTWDRWDDMPVRLYFGSSSVVSVSWSRFEALRVTGDASLPDWYHEWSRIRWVDHGISAADQSLKRTLTNVSLGRGEMSFDGTDIEIWTRLLLGFEGAWLEIFNALDENGYEFHSKMPSCEFRSCI